MTPRLHPILLLSATVGGLWATSAPAAAAEPPGAPTASPEAAAAEQPPTEPASETPAPADTASGPASLGAQSGDDDWVSSIDVAAYLGLGVRLDDPPMLEVTQRAGLLLGLGADLYFTPQLALGVAFEHLELGEEGGNLGSSGTMALSRDLNSLWLRFRAYPIRTESAGMFIAIGVAPTWQSVNATGAVWSPTLPGTVRTFECEGSDTMDVALRAGIGADVDLAGGLRWISAVGLDTYRLSDRALDSCAPGAGSTALFGLRTGLAYGIPLP